MPIGKLAGTAFDPDDIRILGAAFDAACLELGVKTRTDPQAERAAATIIALALQGERDVTQLPRQSVDAWRAVPMRQ